MVSEIKKALFETFRELPPIKANARDSEILVWKKNAAVKKSFEQLFKKIDPTDSKTYMSEIVNKARKGNKKKVTRIQIAFAMSICETLLDPNNVHIQVNEEILKEKLEINLVSFCNFIIELKYFQ